MVIFHIQGLRSHIFFPNTRSIFEILDFDDDDAFFFTAKQKLTTTIHFIKYFSRTFKSDSDDDDLHYKSIHVKFIIYKANA